MPTTERQKKQAAQCATQTGNEKGATRMQLQTFKAVTLVTEVPTASSDVDMLLILAPKRLEASLKKIIYIYIYTQARQGF